MPISPISEDKEKRRCPAKSQKTKLPQARKCTEKQKVSPSPMNVSNQEIKCLNPDEVTKAFNNAIKQDIASKQERGLPIARYDKKSKRAYLEKADGTKEYV